ncbi:uncharacterized protein LOC142241148 [Haematobia irritans]|uniref:uncharacterized protein LOC142241148 n=1 Tax=Haematobia irritans TaxID=7368 RepID=UPI003F4F5478
MINMWKRYRLLVILAHMHIASAISVQVPESLIPSEEVAVPESAALKSPFKQTSTSVKPSTLLLPSGFDPQLPPLQPMLYPFVVPSSTKPTPATRKSIGPFITPGWIPISSSNNIKDIPQSITTSTSHRPNTAPVLEDRISKYVLESNENGPVFESIVYGTWKPDPPLQPVSKLNGTIAGKTSTTSLVFSDGNGGILDNAMQDGKVSNKTISRQHGGFIDNNQPTTIKFENDVHEMSATELIEQKSSKESKDNDERKPSSFNKAHKKQGRQKIRFKSTTAAKSTNTASSSSSSPSSAAAAATTKTGTTTIATTLKAATTSHRTKPIYSTEQSSMTTMEDGIIKVNSTNIPMEVVRQINDSIEIKYNHKQTSRHSIEMTAAHEHYDNHRNDDEIVTAGDDDDDDDDYVELVTKKLGKTQKDQQELQEDEDISVIRMNWPTDFMEVTLTSKNNKSEVLSEEYENESSSQTSHTNSDESAESSELPMALSALNIPPSLWPKLPGNITKLGTPYAAQSSREEPAICVPITVREFNMMNSNEVVNIERVFCFPMPNGISIPKDLNKGPGTTQRTSSSSVNRGRGTSSPVIRASIQNYEEYFESHSTNASSVCRLNDLHWLCCILAFAFKLFLKYY